VTNDWQIPLLETARQDKIQTEGLDPLTGEPLPVDNSADIEDSAFRKISAGIPLNAEEAAQLGVREGYTKPVKSSGGSGGLTASGTSTNAFRKISAGIPLNASEASVLGLPEGYVDPNFEGGGVIDDSSTLDDALVTSIDDIDDNTKRILETLINQPNIYNNDGERLAEILKDRGISEKMVDIYEAWRDSSLNNNVSNNNTFQ